MGSTSNYIAKIHAVIISSRFCSHESIQDLDVLLVGDRLNFLPELILVVESCCCPLSSITRAGHDDGASDEVDDLMMSSTGNSSTTFSPNQASWNETPVSTYRYLIPTYINTHSIEKQN